jgi:hypothetical protein
MVMGHLAKYVHIESCASTPKRDIGEEDLACTSFRVLPQLCIIERVI